MEHLRRYFIAGSLFLLLMVPVQILTTLTFLPSSTPLAIYVGIIILLGLWVKDKSMRYFGYFISFLVLIFLIFRPVFQQGLPPLQIVTFLLSQHESQMLMIAAIVFIFVVHLAFEYQHWKISFVIIFNFLILSQLLKEVDIFRGLIVFLLSSLLLAFLLEQRNLLKNKERLKLAGLVFFILTISLVGALNLPKLFSSQTNILSQATAYVQKELNHTHFYELFHNGNVKNKTGYGENDSELGGPLEKDYSPVFQATFNQEAPTNDFYWRIEAKDYYTGRGWEVATEQIKEVNAAVWTNETTNYVSNEANDITIQTQDNLEYFVTPYGENHFELPLKNQAEIIVEQSYTEKIMPKDKWNSKEYTLINRKPIYTIEQLQHTNFANLETSILTTYTQLPETVPKRVYQLAETLATGKQSTYEQVVAIQEYLKNSGNYLYSQQEAKATPINQDYVDYFLFETKVGYCDNFATSMVVLNRTLGIPTRWVKGFTLGTLVETDKSSPYYQVTNDDAHSWVEVYFPHIGWIPFDPTTDFNGEAQGAESQQVEVESQASRESTSEPLENSLHQENHTNNRLGKNRFILFIIAFITAFGIIGYCFRVRLRMKRLNRYLKKDQAEFIKAFSKLRMIFAVYQRKEAGETVRDYGKRLMKLEPKLCEALLLLLSRYEEIEFGQSKNQYIQAEDRTAFKTVLEVIRESKTLH